MFASSPVVHNDISGFTVVIQAAIVLIPDCISYGFDSFREQISDGIVAPGAGRARTTHDRVITFGVTLLSAAVGTLLFGWYNIKIQASPDCCGPLRRGDIPPPPLEWRAGHPPVC